MFAKELTKIGLSAAVGLLIGLVYAFSQGLWEYILIIPVQTVGIVYSYHYLFRACAAIFQWCSNILSLALGTANCLGIIAGVVLMVVLMNFLVNIMWIVGLVLMLWSLFQAFQQDGMVLQLPQFPWPWRGRKTPIRDDEGGSWDDDYGPDSGQDSWDDDDGGWDDD